MNQYDFARIFSDIYYEKELSEGIQVLYKKDDPEWNSYDFEDYFIEYVIQVEEELWKLKGHYASYSGITFIEAIPTKKVLKTIEVYE